MLIGINKRLPFLLSKIINFTSTWVFLLSRKYCIRKATFSYGHVVMELTYKDWSHARAWALNEKENYLSWMTFYSMPLAFWVPQNLTKMDKWRFIFLVHNPENWLCWTIPTIEGLIKKLFSIIGGWKIVLCGSSSVITVLYFSGLVSKTFLSICLRARILSCKKCSLLFIGSTRFPADRVLCIRWQRRNHSNKK